LAVVLAAVFMQRTPFLSEALMLAAAAASFLTTGRKIHEANQFSFRPMIEIAVLFLGIFATMMPALDLLRRNVFLHLGIHLTPSLAYWGSGAMSAFLDSAPAYLAFLSAMQGDGIGISPVAFNAQIVAAL